MIKTTPFEMVFIIREKMKKHPNNFNVADPQSVNADHQMVEVIHREIDPMGSYTGVPADPEDEPVQDADDL